VADLLLDVGQTAEPPVVVLGVDGECGAVHVEQIVEVTQVAG